MTVVGTSTNLHWDPIPMAELEQARERLRGIALRTPLVRLDADEYEAEWFLKLENLRPVRSFKLRGAYNAMAKTSREALADGVWTVSSGNMAQAVAWSARALDVLATVYVPDTVPRVKLANIVRYGATPVDLSYDALTEVFLTGTSPGAPGRFIHPFSDPDVMAGNGVIGLEMLEDLPEVDAILVPVGGGGLICGVASAIKALRLETKVYGSEVVSGAPMAASFAAGHPVEVPYWPSFVDAISDSCVNPEMFALARHRRRHTGIGA